MPEQPVNAQRFRIVGSGFTLFRYAGSPIKFCTAIQDQAPRPVGNGPQPVQPLDARHPIEIAFPRAATHGVLTLQIIEEWDREFWTRLPGYNQRNINDIVDVFDRSADIGGVTCVKIIKGPRGIRRAVQYHGAQIVDIDMSEQVTIDALTVGRTVTMWYTHTTRKGGRRGRR